MGRSWLVLGGLGALLRRSGPIWGSSGRAKCGVFHNKTYIQRKKKQRNKKRTRPKALCSSKSGSLNKAKALCRLQRTRLWTNFAHNLRTTSAHNPFALCRLQRTRLCTNLAHKVRTTLAHNGAQRARLQRTRLWTNLAHNPCAQPSALDAQ